MSVINMEVYAQYIQKINNPVMPSPWRSSAPSGCVYFPRVEKKRSQLRVVDVNNLKYVSQANDNLQLDTPQYTDWLLKTIHELKGMNRTTLALYFPKLQMCQIDAALALCGYNLSETLNLLLLREKVLKKKKRSANRRLNSTGVRYIPTNDPEVEIVEVYSSSDEKCQNGFPGYMLPKTIDGIDSGSPDNATHRRSSGINVYDFAEEHEDPYCLRKPNISPTQKVGIVLRKNENGLSVDLL